MQKHPMTPKQIRAALAKAGCSQSAIAREMRVSNAAVYQVIEGTHTSHRIRCCIAVTLGLSVDDIWYVKPNPTRLGRPMTQWPGSNAREKTV